MDPQLTDPEMLNAAGMGRIPDCYLDDATCRAVADAQLEKALRWAYQEIMELSTHMHELPHKHGAFRAGVELAAEELLVRGGLEERPLDEDPQDSHPQR